LKAAFKYGYLSKDINADLISIKETESIREFLTLDELRTLLDTPCRDEVLKRAALFSALTGLRHSDIRKMLWKEIIESNGLYTLKYTMQKTSKYSELPLSDEAVELCGERRNPDKLVFEGLKATQYGSRDLAQWLGVAGISRHVTFQLVRHRILSFAL
jgi:integrase